MLLLTCTQWNTQRKALPTNTRFLGPRSALPISLPSIRHAVSVPEYGSNPGTRLGMICLHVPVKGSRDSNSSSSLAFFEGGGKQPVVYNLRHWWRKAPHPVDTRSLRSSTAQRILANYQAQRKGHSLPPKPLSNTPSTPTLGDAAYLEFGTSRQEALFAPHERGEVTSLWQTWHWLSWNSQMNQPITGRIGRSLQRSGICCLLGGFPAFLPYQQYSCRTQLARSQEGSLRSFFLSSLQSKGTEGPLHAKGFNCIVSRDQYVSFLTRNL